MIALGPSVVPTRSFVSGSTMTSRIRNGIVRKILVIKPRIPCTIRQGAMPPCSVATRITPSGIPIA